jgi:hypothetical protein
MRMALYRNRSVLSLGTMRNALVKVEKLIWCRYLDAAGLGRYLQLFNDLDL